MVTLLGIDMHKETTNCNELMEKTAKALTNNSLRLLFVSAKQNNIDLCIKYAVEDPHLPVTEFNILRDISQWFPHVWRVRVQMYHRALLMACPGRGREWEMSGSMFTEPLDNGSKSLKSFRKIMWDRPVISTGFAGLVHGGAQSEKIQEYGLQLTWGRMANVTPAGAPPRRQRKEEGFLETRNDVSLSHVKFQSDATYLAGLKGGSPGQRKRRQQQAAATGGASQKKK
ncbi:hypothetical protein B0H16DRAFT_1469079 [Mycena metata]|uniref:Uncharacterized protein n=1 Tax=Mycena metata TaxID=1033252 RepID=A0AAD7HYY1_9AGAR|nr:hypothetical protein B0H16DRAFT_1469079 [Mycena metata]